MTSETYAGAGALSLEAIDAGALLPRADALKRGGWRLVQILAVSLPEGVELSYAFGFAAEMTVLRFVAPTGSPVPSLTPVYAAAFLYENEIRDLFHVSIEGVVPDWMGKTYDVVEAGRFDRFRLEMKSSEEGGR